MNMRPHWDETKIARDDAGRFAEQTHDRPDIELEDGPTGERAREYAARAEQMATANGYVKPMADRAYQNPAQRGDGESVQNWWDTRNAQAEYSGDSKGYEKMPDDFTPSRGTGNSLSGHRRTHRMNYSGAGISMRMPSATSVRAFADTQKGKSFDVPVEATYEGGTVSGWVRCTKGEDGTWMTEGLGFEGNQRQVAEAVSAVLEARRVRTALAGYSSMDERRAERLARAGARIRPVDDSSFIKGIAVNPVAGLTFTKIRDKVYTNKTVTNIAEFQQSYSKGREYNDKIKSAPSLGEAKQCEKCQGYYSPALGSHVCLRASHSEPQQLQDEYLGRRRERGASFLSSFAKRLTGRSSS